MSDFQDSIAIHYHERTKYRPESIASKSKGLDWSKQPIPFKEYKIGTAIDLKNHLKKPGSRENSSLLTRLSQLLYCSYGITAKIATLVGPHVYLRAAPSAGGLYPAEVYLLCRGLPSLPPGLYNYQPPSHSLIHFWESQEIWPELEKACFDHPLLKETPLVLVTSAIFYRSAWRYEARAYRRIFLDTGHLLGNIELSGAINQFRPYLIGGFQDALMNQLLYLDPQQEAVISVIPLLDLTQESPSIPRPPFTALSSKINSNYEKVEDGELLYYFHKETEIIDNKPRVIPTEKETETGLDKYNFPFCLRISTNKDPIDWGKDLEALENCIFKRRSTRAYTGANLDLEELKALLNFTYQPESYMAQGLDSNPDYFALELLETFIAVSGVNGLEEGCYYYSPKAQELRQIRFKNFRRELHFLCLGQDLGRDAAALIFHTADLKKAIQKYGDRAYRYLHLDAGHLGQRLNLGAIRLGLGVSGIGGFFDDRVNEVLGIPVDEAVIYITTLGRPKEI